MIEPPPAPERVDPAHYTRDYYLTNCHGHEDFAESAGRSVGPRFRYALSLAGGLRGKRVLDVGCGRGEIVVQSALRGAEAWGIDYAQAAVEIARRALDQAGGESLRARMQVAQMDVQALAFPDESFDVVFMMDVVEHLYPRELDEALREVRRVLRPGGVLIVHTSPNTVFEQRVYRGYSRHINRLALNLATLLKLDRKVWNAWMLPASDRFPQGAFGHVHINEQDGASLRRTARRNGFRVTSLRYWEPPTPDLYPWGHVEYMLLDVLRFLRPFSFHRPLSRLFCNHIWMTAERP